jgi:hypothetical protein
MLRRAVAVLVGTLLVAAVGVAVPASTAATTSVGPESAMAAGVDSAPVVGSPAVVGSDRLVLSLVLVALAVLGLGIGIAWYAGVLPGPRDGDTTAEGSAPVDRSEPGTGTVTSDTAEETQQELLSDEDRVLQLLEEHGGRMKQVHIVEQTDWSKSKVSMLLSDMEEDGAISKLRVGRENIISLAGEEPEAAGSPFDDE